MIFVNFKTYQEGTGEKALRLAEICQQVGQDTGVKIIPLVQAVDIFRLSSLGFNIWAQHVDDIDLGPNTGQVLPQAILAAGAKGSLLNHSENKLPLEVIGSIIEKLKTLKAEKFGILVCSESVEEGSKIAQFGPDLIAYEPPELIGKDISVSSAKPGIIHDFVKEIKDIPVLVGAGIHTQEDVKMALRLGVVGILVASDIVLAKNPKKELLDLAEGFK